MIIAGDLTAKHSLRELDYFNGWIREQPYDKKILIGGNHDTFFEQGVFNIDDPRDGTVFVDPCVEYLCDSGTEFEGLKLWGSPWSSQFPGINPRCCAFTRPFMERLIDRWELIPDDTDILITHTPPYGILDQVATDYGASVGDKDLRDHVFVRFPKLKLHVFGHIHENGGQQMMFKRPGYGTENNTIFVNASIVNERYQHVNKPVRVIL